jgi:hypothetical protein
MEATKLHKIGGCGSITDVLDHVKVYKYFSSIDNVAQITKFLHGEGALTVAAIQPMLTLNLQDLVMSSKCSNHVQLKINHRPNTPQQTW